MLDILKEHGFKVVSLSDELRAELTARGIPITRPALGAVGNELRGKHGFGVLAQRVLERIANDKGSKYAVDSIRHPEEVRVLRSSPRFRALIAIDAPASVRYKRCCSRSREGEGTTMKLEDFLAGDDAELYGREGSQRVRECMVAADWWILNTGPIDEIRTSLVQHHLVPPQ